MRNIRHAKPSKRIVNKHQEQLTSSPAWGSLRSDFRISLTLLGQWEEHVGKKILQLFPQVVHLLLSPALR